MIEEDKYDMNRYHVKIPIEDLQHCQTLCEQKEACIGTQWYKKESDESDNCRFG